MIICVTGTPGTGKTTLAKLLAKRLSYTYVDVGALVRKEKLHEGYDRSKRSYVVDSRKVGKLLEKTLSKGHAILDSLFSHDFSPEWADACIVTTCRLKELERRLRKRKYSQKKIRENLDAEIFEVCRTEALENSHSVIVLDTTQGIKRGSVEKLIGELNLESAG